MKSKRPRSSFKPLAVIFDVDGVLTPGNFYYSADGKIMKEFGADDHDALLLLRSFVDIHFITGDKKGFAITARRIVKDMKLPLSLVSTVRRVEWIKERWPLSKTIYMGDGIFDTWVFKHMGYSICPSDGCHFARAAANYVTKNPGGRRAVSEACLHILEKFFKAFNPNKIPSSLKFGEWSR